MNFMLKIRIALFICWKKKTTHYLKKKHAGFLTLLYLCACKAAHWLQPLSFRMLLKLLGDTVCVVISFLGNLQSQGQTTQKAILSPVKLARHPQQKTLNSHVLKHLTPKRARHQIEQKPANSTLLPEWAGCPYVLTSGVLEQKKSNFFPCNLLAGLLLWLLLLQRAALHFLSGLRMTRGKKKEKRE